MKLCKYGHIRGPNEKTCIKCGQLKQLTEFYLNSHMADGRIGKCKSCVKAYVREWSRRNTNHRQQYKKKYAKRPEYKEIRQRNLQRYKQKFPDKISASSKINEAIKRGEIKRQPCEICGAAKVHAHHDDYREPLKVRWLCEKHHFEYHVKQRALARETTNL